MSIVRVETLANVSGDPVVRLNPDGTTEFFSAYDPGGFTLPTWADSDSRPTTGLVPYSIGYNLGRRQAELYAGLDENGQPLWFKLPTRVQFGGVSTYNDIADISSAISSFSFSEVSNIKTGFESFGYTLISTPTYQGTAEQMIGTTNISALGQFNYSEFDSGAELQLSSGFGDNGLNDFPYMIFAGFSNTGFAGMAAMMYTDYGIGTALRDFFAPNQNRNLACYVRNADGSEREAATGQSTIFSDGQFPNANGYNSTTRFASDDGSWGFRFGATRLDGNGGPYLRDNSADAYGCENPNSSDSAANNFYWGSATATTSYGFYFAVKKV